MARIRHFDHHHASVEEVRRCGARNSVRRSDADAPKVTEPQLIYIGKLLEQRDVPAAVREKIETEAEHLSKSEASATIDRLKEFSFKPRPKGNPYPAFEDGYYALREEDGVVHFYRLSHDDRTDSRYYGWPVVQAQASDDLHLIKDRERKTAIINAVNADKDAARMLYASELGNCWRCGRTLTDEESRRLGIGPVCRGKVGAAA